MKLSVIMPAYNERDTILTALERVKAVDIEKEIIIVDTIPLTAVGKVFKPGLRFDAIKRVCRKELAALVEMVRSLEVRVKEDPRHGAQALILIEPSAGIEFTEVAERVNDILARYTFHYELEPGPARRASMEQDR